VTPEAAPAFSADTVRLISIFGIGVVLVLITGLYSIITTRNLLRVLIGIEILAKSVTLLLIVVGYAANQIALAQALVITLIIIEVALMVVAIGVVLCVHRTTGSIDAAVLRELKG